MHELLVIAERRSTSEDEAAEGCLSWNRAPTLS
jgi:hypothetical protein